MSKLEDEMAFHIRAYNLPDPVKEYHFHPERKWRFDFAWPDLMIALECEGGIYASSKNLCQLCGQPPRSRHTSMSGFEGDCEKYNQAAILGWKVLRVTTKTIDSGSAIDLLRKMIKGGKT